VKLFFSHSFFVRLAVEKRIFDFDVYGSYMSVAATASAAAGLASASMNPKSHLSCKSIDIE
jgi:hypothetical protein